MEVGGECKDGALQPAGLYMPDKPDASPQADASRPANELTSQNPSTSRLDSSELSPGTGGFMGGPLRDVSSFKLAL